MVLKIERENSRFKEIIRGRIKRDLRKYITKGEFIGKRGKEFISIPVPHIDIPDFRYNYKDIGGVGQGKGAKGQPIGIDDSEGGAGPAGDQPGEHILEVDITLEELAAMLGDELELPNIQPKGKKDIKDARERYTSITRSGPETLRHFKRTYKEALKRQIISNTYDPSNPIIIPIKEDKRYRSWHLVDQPINNAVIIYMMDVSGSMGEEQKEIVRIESFWIDTWLNSQYKDIESRYIIHDAEAREVDKEIFYSTKESGGTKISSAYTLANKIIDKDYNPADWNIYPFHFSDGDNWGGGDTEVCLKLLESEILPKVNLFCYGQVIGTYGSGQFQKDMDKQFHSEEKVIISEVENVDSIYNSLKQFLGKGK